MPLNYYGYWILFRRIYVQCICILLFTLLTTDHSVHGEVTSTTSHGTTTVSSSSSVSVLCSVSVTTTASSTVTSSSSVSSIPLFSSSISSTTSSSSSPSYFVSLVLQILSSSSSVSASSTASRYPTITGTPSSVPIILPGLVPPSVSSSSRRISLSSSPTRTRSSSNRIVSPFPSASNTIRILRTPSPPSSSIFNWQKLHYISGEIILQNITLTADQFLDSHYWLIGQRFRTVLANYLHISNSYVYILAVHDIVNNIADVNKVITEEHPINLYNETFNPTAAAYPRILPYIYASLDITLLFPQPKLGTLLLVPSPSSTTESLPNLIGGGTKKGIGICFRIVTYDQGKSNENNVLLAQYYLNQLIILFNQSVLSLPSLRTNSSSSSSLSLEKSFFFYTWLYPFSVWLWNTTSTYGILPLDPNEERNNDADVYGKNNDLYTILLLSQSLVIHEPKDTSAEPEAATTTTTTKSIFFISLITVVSVLGFLMIISILTVQYRRYRSSAAVSPTRGEEGSVVPSVSTIRIDYGGLWSPENRIVVASSLSKSTGTTNLTSSSTTAYRRKSFLAENIRKRNTNGSQTVSSSIGTENGNVTSSVTLSDKNPEEEEVHPTESYASDQSSTSSNSNEPPVSISSILSTSSSITTTAAIIPPSVQEGDNNTNIEYPPHLIHDTNLGDSVSELSYGTNNSGILGEELSRIEEEDCSASKESSSVEL